MKGIDDGIIIPRVALSICVFSSDMHIDVTGDGAPVETGYVNGASTSGKVRVNGAINGTGSGSRTPAGDDWELDCEICHRQGVNQVSIFTLT